MTYTIEQTHQMLREAAFYSDDNAGSYRINYVEDLVYDIDGNPYCNVVMTNVEDGEEGFLTDGEEVTFNITDFELDRQDVCLYKLTLMNP